jgi:hypothetical protein
MVSRPMPRFNEGDGIIRGLLYPKTESIGASCVKEIDYNYIHVYPGKPPNNSYDKYSFYNSKVLQLNDI